MIQRVAFVYYAWKQTRQGICPHEENPFAESHLMGTRARGLGNILWKSNRSQSKCVDVGSSESYCLCDIVVSTGELHGHTTPQQILFLFSF